VHDESLITIDDAKRLIELGVADVFNIRISKCGGLLPALHIAALARRSSVRIQLGCMVGETSILSAAGIRFLEVCPGVEWAEGCFGSFLLRSDVVAKGVRFGYGGRIPRLLKTGLGIAVDPRRLEQLCVQQPEVINL
jgi:muconate cycloisomerase